MLVANFSNVHVFLNKGTKLASALPVPYTLVHPKRKPEVTSVDEEEFPPEIASLELPNVPEEHRESVKKMLAKHREIWTGHLGEISTAVHRIELIPGGKPVRQMSYRQGPAGRQYEKKKIDRMLK